MEDIYIESLYDKFEKLRAVKFKGSQEYDEMRVILDEIREHEGDEAADTLLALCNHKTKVGMGLEDGHDDYKEQTFAL